MDEHNVEYTYKGILFCLKKELISDNALTHDELRRYHAKYNKPRHKRADVIALNEVSRTANSQDRKQKGGYQRQEEGRNRELLFNGYRASFGVKKF